MEAQETMKKTLQVTNEAISLLAAKEKDFSPQYFMMMPIEEPKSISSSLQPSEIEYDIFGLMALMIYALQERQELALNENYPAKLLKNTNIKGTYLLEGIRRMLSDYRHIKCVALRQKGLAVSFVSCLQLTTLRHLLNVYAIGKNATVELVKKKNRNYLQLKIQQETIIEISDMCIMFCNQPATSQALYDQVQIMAELIALVEKDLIFIGSELIQLNIFTPFIALSAPQLFEKTFLANLAELSEELNRGVIPSALRETRKSRMYHQQDGDRRYLLDKQYYDEHIEYVIYLPTERSLLIRFSLQFDREEINTLLAEKQFRSYPIKTKHQDKFVIKKGGSSRGVNRVFTRTNWQVFDQDRLVLTLCGKDTVLLPLDNIAAALELFADIYYRRMFISSWLPSAEVPCDLTDYERQVIKNMKNLFLIYNFFVKPVLDKEFSEAAQRIVFLESQEEDPEPQLAYEWLYQQLNSIKEDDYFEKFHCLLLAINEVVDQQMPIMMRLSAMQCDRALELQSRLLKMIGVSQVFLNSYKRQELLLV